VKPLGGGLARVFFSSRDELGRSQVGWFDFDPRRPGEIVAVCEEPSLGPGPLGAFDEHGAMASWVVDHEDQTWLYYIGWMRGVTVPFHNAIGLALSEDGGRTFHRVAEGPIIGRDAVDPYFTASSCVLHEGAMWRMWYLSCTGWEEIEGAPRHRYHIRHATSRDGVSWERTGRACIDFESEDEYAISRPSVVRDADVYRMWYAHRGDRYRLGYAESVDGISWTRRDAEVGIDVSPAGWDSEMIEYACVFDHGGRRFMLYNGNDYGRSGIGLAEAQPEHSMIRCV
jgi:hypothetical protein